MTRHARRRPPVLAPAAALLTLAACGGTTQLPSTGGTGGAGAAQVTAQNVSFMPDTLTVPADTRVTITFHNKDSVEHSLTFDDSSKSVDADGGETATLTFMSSGAGTTIAFHCKYHPTRMRGTITIGGGGGAMSSSAPAPSSTSSSSSASY